MNIYQLSNANNGPDMFQPGPRMDAQLKALGLTMDDIEWAIGIEWARAFERVYCIMPVGRIVWHKKKDVPVPLDHFGRAALEMHVMHQFCISKSNIPEQAVQAAKAAGQLKEDEMNRLIIRVPEPGTQVHSMLLRSKPGEVISLPDPDRAILVDEEGKVLADSGDPEPDDSDDGHRLN